MNTPIKREDNSLQKDKGYIVRCLRERGMRMTDQRLLILDILLRAENIDCKEIYFLAHKENHNIGRATVYRTINMLTENGFIHRSSALNLDGNEDKSGEEDPDMKKFLSLTPGQQKQVVAAGLKKCGY